MENLIDLHITEIYKRAVHNSWLVVFEGYDIAIVWLNIYNNGNSLSITTYKATKHEKLEYGKTNSTTSS
jgi:hypothetical protein